jgi:hypothetical protein
LVNIFDWNEKNTIKIKSNSIHHQVVVVQAGSTVVVQSQRIIKKAITNKTQDNLQALPCPYGNLTTTERSPTGVRERNIYDEDSDAVD